MLDGKLLDDTEKLAIRHKRVRNFLASLPYHKIVIFAHQGTIQGLLSHVVYSLNVILGVFEHPTDIYLDHGDILETKFNSDQGKFLPLFKHYRNGVHEI